eukprot:1323165-Pleurochrysis_carterae.AAC.1
MNAKLVHLVHIDVLQLKQYRENVVECELTAVCKAGGGGNVQMPAETIGKSVDVQSQQLLRWRKYEREIGLHRGSKRHVDQIHCAETTESTRSDGDHVLADDQRPSQPRRAHGRKVGDGGAVGRRVRIVQRTVKVGDIVRPRVDIQACEMGPGAIRKDGRKRSPLKRRAGAASAGDGDGGAEDDALQRGAILKLAVSERRVLAADVCVIERRAPLADGAAKYERRAGVGVEANLRDARGAGKRPRSATGQCKGDVLRHVDKADEAAAPGKGFVAHDARVRQAQ